MLFATEKSFIIYNANTKTSVNSNICPKEKYTWKKDKKTKRQKDKKTKRPIKMHGGNPTVIASLDELAHPNEYTQIYVGVGTKWHNFEDSFFISRSQLLPSFLHLFTF